MGFDSNERFFETVSESQQFFLSIFYQIVVIAGVYKVEHSPSPSGGE